MNAGRRSIDALTVQAQVKAVQIAACLLIEYGSSEQYLYGNLYVL